MASSKFSHDGLECRNQMLGPKGLTRYTGKVAPFLTSISFRSTSSADAQQVVSEPVASVRFSQGAISEGGLLGVRNDIDQVLARWPGVPQSNA
ncbi:unnamed protein product [Lactuca saligna]|uniref:Uncharacterized protein n=1 Tax=Lactuca saligna TaxID=75948 RepID=A0AA35YW61_LACSI|nr:unnamed protein product [Lactuca saligna]